MYSDISKVIIETRLTTDMFNVFLTAADIRSFGVEHFDGYFPYSRLIFLPYPDVIAL